VVAFSWVASVAATILAVALESPNESTPASSDPSLLAVPSLLLSLSDPDPEDDVTPLDDESNTDSLSVMTVARIPALLDELDDTVLRWGEVAIRVLFAAGSLADELDELASEMVREFLLEAFPGESVFDGAA